MGNTRGNKYSTGHTTLNAETSPEYWYNTIPDYQAKYDVPAFIEKVKELSHVKKVAYIGHSMGSRGMLLNLEQNGTYYKENVNFVTLLSPFVELHGTSLINYIIVLGNIFIDDYRPDGIHYYKSFESPSALATAFKYVCGYAGWYCDFWSLYMSHSTGEYNDKEKSKVFFSKYPAQSSFKAWKYMKQLLDTNKPYLYDFGTEENMKRYG